VDTCNDLLETKVLRVTRTARHNIGGRGLGATTSVCLVVSQLLRLPTKALDRV
jgi:hypothetical protein